MYTTTKSVADEAAQTNKVIQWFTCIPVVTKASNNYYLRYYLMFTIEYKKINKLNVLFCKHKNKQNYCYLLLGESVHTCKEGICLWNNHKKTK